MIQHIRQAVEVDIDERDLITPKDAARLSKRSLSTVLSLMALDKLPIYTLPQDERERAQRYTSKKAVLALRETKRQSSPDDNAGE